MCTTTLADLLQEALKGNVIRATFDKAFCEEFYEFVFLTVRKFIKNNQDAEDVTQDVFTKKILSLELDRFTGILSGNVKGWLHTTARNYCLDHLRLNKKWSQLENIEKRPELSNDSSETDLSNDLTWEDLSKKMPEDVREILELKVLEGLTYEEIGKTLELTVGQIKMKIKRWRDSFKK